MQIASVSALAVLALTPAVNAHGYISNIISDGKSYIGSNPNWVYLVPYNQEATTAGWFAYNQDNGFVEPNSYTSPNISCHKAATPGSTTVPVAAGSKLSLQWNTWPDSHKGPVIDYLAKCASANCAGATETGLSWTKIDQAGLISDATVPGTWATDQLIAANFTWSVTIPSTLAPGNYVLRHEIIALHSAGSSNGAQNYPQCINLQVTGSGSTALPAGTAGTALYKTTDPGILINIYQTLASYTIPGPALWTAKKKKREFNA